MLDGTIVIAGGGASGTLLAAELIRRSENVRVIVMEPRSTIGPGVAYSTSCPAHLLNVPASTMSAFTDDPNHFVRWADERAGGKTMTDAFLPRSMYGEYLEAIAAQIRETARDRFVHIRATCLDVAVEDSGIVATGSDERLVRGDAFVLAIGNAAPANWSGDAVRDNRYFSSAWNERAFVMEDPSETVLLLGTGLTAVDAVLGLRHNGHRGTIYMVSRRGLLPHEHRLFDTPPTANPEGEHIGDLLGTVKHLIKGEEAPANWRSSIDAVRPHTNELWQAMTLEEQRRFVRHATPYWNVHRHRLAPEAAKALANLIASDTLRVVTGRTGEIVQEPHCLRIPIKLRGEQRTIFVEAARVINCSGPEHDFARLESPLICSLLRKGLLATLPLGIGVDIAQTGALRSSAGQDAARLFAIGPVRYGTLIETTAIPEIQTQAHNLAVFLIATVLRMASRSVSCDSKSTRPSKGSL